MKGGGKLSEIKLNERQRRFADEYIICGVAETAALKAGYSEKYARSDAHKLLAHTGIKEIIDKRNKLLESKKIATMQEVREFWTTVIRDEDTDMKDRIKVSELIGKSNGEFLDRVEQSGGIDIRVDWHD